VYANASGNNYNLFASYYCVNFSYYFDCSWSFVKENIFYLLSYPFFLLQIFIKIKILKIIFVKFENEGKFFSNMLPKAISKRISDRLVKYLKIVKFNYY
jgi:hypothetical protein